MDFLSLIIYLLEKKKKTLCMLVQKRDIKLIEDFG